MLVIAVNFITSNWTGKNSTFLKTMQGYVFIFLNAQSALHLLDEAIATPRQPLHTASSLLRTVGTPTPLRQQPVSALRHSACKYSYTLYYSCSCVIMMYKPRVGNLHVLIIYQWDAHGIFFYYVHDTVCDKFCVYLNPFSFIQN